MKYMYFCYKCGFIGSAEGKIDGMRCPKCSTELFYTNYSKENWALQTDGAKNELLEKWKGIADPAERERLEEEKRQQYRQEAMADQAGTLGLMTTSGTFFHGYRAEEYLGVFTGEAVMGTGFLSEISASIDDLFGTENNSMRKKLHLAKRLAAEDLYRHCALSGANAVIGVTYDIMKLSENMIVASASGTAVVVRKVQD